MLTLVQMATVTWLVVTTSSPSTPVLLYEIGGSSNSMHVCETVGEFLKATSDKRLNVKFTCIETPR